MCLCRFRLKFVFHSKQHDKRNAASLKSFLFYFLYNFLIESSIFWIAVKISTTASFIIEKTETKQLMKTMCLCRFRLKFVFHSKQHDKRNAASLKSFLFYFLYNFLIESSIFWIAVKISTTASFIIEKTETKHFLNIDVQRNLKRT